MGFYSTAIEKLQSHFSAPRTLPKWCVCLRPITIEETNRFIQYACYLTRLHLEVACVMVPIEFGARQRIKEISNCHRRFCDNQIRNDKTRKVLASSFGDEKARKYMRE